MSKRIGNLSRVWTNIKNSFFIAKQTNNYVGSDQFGNQYFERIGDSDRNARGQRFIKEGKGASPNDIPDVPVEWEAWLRGRRKNPPTEEEIQKNYVKMMQTKLRAQKLDHKYQPDSEQVLDKSISGDITETIVSNDPRAAFPTYEDYEVSPGQKYNKDGSTIK